MIKNPAYPRRVAIVANGAIHDFEAMGTLLKTFPFAVAADGGLFHCQRMGVIPNLIVGDLDSISPALLSEYAEVPQKKYSPHKDKTDLELAVEEVFLYGTEEVVLFGALGKRLDHALYNVYLLQRYPGKVVVESEWETLSVLGGEATVSCFPGQTVSLLPLGNFVKGVTSKGLKWELHEAVFDQNYMSLSNICLSNSFSISIQEGELLCCRCKQPPNAILGEV